MFALKLFVLDTGLRRYDGEPHGGTSTRHCGEGRNPGGFKWSESIQTVPKSKPGSVPV